MDVVASPTKASLPQPPELSPATEERAGLVPSHGISIDVDPPSQSDRPPLIKHVSTPAYNSPLRHHRRNPSTPRHVKESLNAHSEYITSQDDGSAQQRINQYIIKQEIGRGSFGAVHLAVDQYGQEYAVKEFSKSRLRKRAQSHILRRPRSQQRRPGHLAAGKSFNSPLHRNSSGDSAEPGSSIELIKEEIAVMKKLNHNNLVSLIEVLDDPNQDSLYMVMEMCKKGVVMKVGLDEHSDPYPDESCRCWFRDLILGIEYLHAQGVVHRDIKPDNCLLTNDDVLKVVDFGVSEMFEKDSDMRTAKSAGSPAFLPPELCRVKHGDVSGKAADIWSMGVTLYCLKYGKIPFEKSGIFELYEAIKSDDLSLNGDSDKDFQDLMLRILEKDPAKRITMPELREHPWVTKRGTDPLLSEEENTRELVEPPTKDEMADAITGNMTNLLTVVKAVKKFKSLVDNNRPPRMNTILGDEDSGHFSQPPLAMKQKSAIPPHLSHKSHSVDTFDRSSRERALAVEGVHREFHHGGPRGRESGSGKVDSGIGISADLEGDRGRKGGSPTPVAGARPPNKPTDSSTDSEGSLSRMLTAGDSPPTDPEALGPFRATRGPDYTSDDLGHRGHAHDPLQDHLYLYVGPSTFSTPSQHADRRPGFVSEENDVPVVSESPGAADIDIYETAYRDEIERIQARTQEEGREPTVFLTRRVDERLMALGGLAGRWAAMGEEGLGRVGDATGFREGKAKVGGVSRALREVAKEEYRKRKQERKLLAEAKAEKAKATGQDESAAEIDSEMRSQVRKRMETSTKEEADRPQPEPRSSSRFERAQEKGKQAKTSFKGMMDMMKERAKTSKAEGGGG